MSKDLNSLAISEDSWITEWQIYQAVNKFDTYHRHDLDQKMVEAFYETEKFFSLEQDPKLLAETYLLLCHDNYDAVHSLFKDEIKYTEKNPNTDTLVKLQNIWLGEQIKALSIARPEIIEEFIKNCSHLTFENKSALIEKINITKINKVKPLELAELGNTVKKLSTILSPLQFNKLLTDQQSELLQDFIISIQIFYLNNKIKEKIKLSGEFKKADDKLAFAEEEIDQLLEFFVRLLKKKIWAFLQIEEIIETKINKFNWGQFIQMFAVIHDYKINYEFVKTSFEKKPELCASDLHQRALTSLFADKNPESSREFLLDKMFYNVKDESKKNNSELKLIDKFYQEFKFYSKEDIKEWSVKIKAGGISLVEVIAVLERAEKLLHSDYIPRDTQRLALLNLLKASDSKRLAEIKTGEGKSLIVAMLAVILVLTQKTSVDIVTSSSELAKRDAEKQKDFYALFDISVGHNIVESLEEKSIIYKNDIVYGDASNFQADILREDFLQQKTREGRLCNAVIVDEVDSMFIDQGRDATRLSEPFPGVHHLNNLLAFIWRRLFEIGQSAGDNIANLNEEQLYHTLKTAVMDLTGMRWYTDEDISTYTRFFITHQLKGFKTGCRFLLNDVNKVLLAPVGNSRAEDCPQAPAVDFYFNKHKQPHTDKDHKPYDLFDELTHMLRSQPRLKIQILFAYNLDDCHWTLAELELSKSNEQYEINVFVHDPRGAGEMSDADFQLLSQSIQLRLKEEGIHNIIRINKKGSAYACHGERDENSSGVIVAEEILKKLQNKTSLEQKNYSSGCRNLRDQQYQLIKNQYQLVIMADKPSGQARDMEKNKIICYKEDEEWCYAYGALSGKIFQSIDDNQKKRIEALLNAQMTGKSIDETDSYSIISEILSKSPEHEAEIRFLQNNRVNYPLPHYLQALFFQQLSYWIESALQAKYHLSLGKEYAIHKGQIVPVDYRSTGVTQHSTQWEYGLHQFLQLKHQLPISPMSLITNYLSVSSFFKKYRIIYGVSGTLGTPAQRKFLFSTYCTDTVFIPTFKPRQLQELQASIVPNEKIWLTRIVDNALREVAAGRAVLIIADSKLNAKKIIEKLKSKKTQINNLIEYTDSDDQNQKSQLDQPANAGDIIVATNLAGRGTDIIISSEVEKNKGLHTMITFFADNIRVECQAAGRGGRKGQPGSWQVIVNQENLLESGYESVDDIDTLLIERDKREQDTLSYLSINQNKINDFKQALFEKFNKFLKTYKQSEESKRIHSINLQGIKERWGIWLQVNCDENIFLLKNNEKDLQEEIAKINLNYSNFEIELETDIAVGNFFSNPYLMIAKGNVYLQLAQENREKKSRGTHCSLARKWYKSAREFDPYCAWLTYHNEAFSWLIEDEKTIITNSQYHELLGEDEKVSPVNDQLDKSEPAKNTQKGQAKPDKENSSTPSPKDSGEFKMSSNPLFANAQTCLLEAKKSISQQVLPNLQMSLGLIHHPFAPILVRVINRPDDEKIKTHYNKIYVYFADEKCRYVFCENMTNEVLIEGDIADQELIIKIKLMPAVDDYQAMSDQKQSRTSQPTEDIIKHILALHKPQEKSPEALLYLAKNHELTQYQVISSGIDTLLYDLGKSPTIQLNWQRFETDPYKNNVHLQEMGFIGSMNIQAYKEYQFPWSALIVGALAVAQIVGGAFLVSTGLFVGIGQGLIAEGVSDILFVVQAIITGEFSWEAYLWQKAISLVLSIVMFGVGKLAKLWSQAVNLGKTAGKLSSAARRVRAIGTKIKAISSKITHSRVFQKISKPFKAIYESVRQRAYRLAQRLSAVKGSFVIKSSLQNQAKFTMMTSLKIVGKELISQGGASLLSMTIDKLALPLIITELQKSVYEDINKKMFQSQDFTTNLSWVLKCDGFYGTNKNYSQLRREIGVLFYNDPAWKKNLLDLSRKLIEAFFPTLNKNLKGGDKIIGLLVSEGIRLAFTSHKILNSLEFSDILIKKITDDSVSIQHKERYIILKLNKDSFCKRFSNLKDPPKAYSLLEQNQIINKDKHIAHEILDLESDKIQLLQRELGDFSGGLIEGLKIIYQTKTEELKNMAQGKHPKLPQVISQFSEMASHKIANEIAQEIARQANYMGSKVVNYIANESVPIPELVAHEQKKSAKNDHSEPRDLDGKPVVSPAGLLTKAERRLEAEQQKLNYQYMIQKTQEQDCRGSLMHILALSDDLKITVKIYDKHRKTIIPVGAAHGHEDSARIMYLEYDSTGKGHYSYLQPDAQGFKTINFSGSQGKNNCLFTCFDYHVNGDASSPERIAEWRNRAAGHLHKNSQNWQPFYNSVIDEKGSLMKGGIQLTKSHNRRYLRRRTENHTDGSIIVDSFTIDKQDLNKGTRAGTESQKYVQSSEAPVPAHISHRHRVKGKKGSSGRLKNKIPSRKKVDAGHLLAKSLGGSGKFPNIIPQNQELNQGRAGKDPLWKKHDREVAKQVKKTGKRAHVTITHEYTPEDAEKIRAKELSIQSESGADYSRSSPRLFKKLSSPDVPPASVTKKDASAKKTTRSRAESGADYSPSTS